jgi:pimeloyl-ACP methyl ester carboxylesterase
MTELKTDTLDVPGAVLHYDVRTDDASTTPALLLIGSPMGAGGFGTLADHFTDRTVVTYDPRGAERSVRTDDATESTPDEHAADLHRLVAALDAGPVDVFASSGGAVNALALVARHPEQVRTLVAHEPPAAQELPDREHALAACQDIHDTYQRSGFGPPWPSSSCSSATRAPSRPASPTRPLRTLPVSGCRRRTTAHATMCWSGRTS